MDTKDDFPLESRPPSLEDLLELCRHLNDMKVQYIVIGGMAVIQHGFTRATEDIDLLVSLSEQNEARLKQSLSYLPDKAINEIKPGDIEKYSVIRVADEIVIDLIGSACGIDYSEASKSVEIINIHGVSIPFANLELLWKLKQTHREKDAQDRLFIKNKMNRV